MSPARWTFATARNLSHCVPHAREGHNATNSVAPLRDRLDVLAGLASPLGLLSRTIGEQAVYLGVHDPGRRGVRARGSRLRPHPGECLQLLEDPQDLGAA